MIRIWSQPHCMFAAIHMVSQLHKLGFTAKMVNEIDPNSEDLHILYQFHNQFKAPKNYIICQTEVSTSHWVNSHYMNHIKHARAVWDYSALNVGKYIDTNPNVTIVTPGIVDIPESEKDIDFLFYGWIEGSEHRRKVIDKLQQEIPLTVITNTVQSEMWNILSRTKVVINVQHKEGNPLEVYRINEALSYHCHVVSEGYGALYPMVVFESQPEIIAAEVKIDVRVLGHDPMKKPVCTVVVQVYFFERIGI